MNDDEILREEPANSPLSCLNTDIVTQTSLQSVKNNDLNLTPYMQSVLDFFYLENEQEIKEFHEQIGLAGKHEGLFVYADWNCPVFLDPSLDNVKSEDGNNGGDGFCLIPLKGDQTFFNQKLGRMIKNGVVDAPEGKTLAAQIKEVKMNDGLMQSIRFVFKPHSVKFFRNASEILELNLYSEPPLLAKAKKERAEKGTHKDFQWVNKYPCIKLLFKNLCVFEDRMEYSFNWLSYIFNTLEKTGNAIIFKGAQGTGKTTLFTEIIAYLLGNKFAFQLGQGAITSKYAPPAVVRALFVGFNEVKCDSTDKNSGYEKLKTYITDSRIQVEIKHVSERTVENHFNCIFFSNNDTPIQIQSGDRRYTVFTTNNEDLKDVCQRELGIDKFEYFDRLRKERDEFIIDLIRYEYDKKQACEIMPTDEKTAVQKASDTKQSRLRHSLLNLEPDFFEDMIQKAENDFYNEDDDAKSYIWGLLQKTSQPAKITRDYGVGQYMRAFCIYFQKFIELNGCAPAADVEFFTRLFFYESNDDKKTRLSWSDLGKKLDGAFSKSMSARVIPLTLSLEKKEDEKKVMAVRKCGAWERIMAKRVAEDEAESFQGATEANF